MSTEDPTVMELLQAGKLEEAQEALWHEFNKARDMESHAINEFEKMLWLTNSGAATVTIGYLTTASDPTFIQFMGCCAFVSGILFLLIMKFVGETNAVRDRARRQKASGDFFLEEKPISSLEKIRDKKFKALAWIYKSLKFGSAILFMAGCILTLVGFYSTVSEKVSHNNALQPTSALTRLLG